VWLRSGETSSLVSIVEPPARLSEATIALRLAAVMAFYRYHQLNGVAGAGRLYERVHRGGGSYKPFLEHLARRTGRRRAGVAVRRRHRGAPPVLAPAQMAAIKDACARWDEPGRRWVGSLRHRLLWSVAEETGMRIGEVLSLQHRDWHTGRGDTPFVEVVPREHPHGLQVKGGAYRKLYVSDELDRLYGDYLVELCERGADTAVADLRRAPRPAPTTRRPPQHSPGALKRLRRSSGHRSRLTPLTSRRHLAGWQRTVVRPHLDRRRGSGGNRTGVELRARLLNSLSGQAHMKVSAPGGDSRHNHILEELAADLGCAQSACGMLAAARLGPDRTAIARCRCSHRAIDHHLTEVEASATVCGARVDPARQQLAEPRLAWVGDDAWSGWAVQPRLARVAPGTAGEHPRAARTGPTARALVAA
jgi:integrase